MIHADRPALVLAPMDGVTDAPMRALMGELGAFTHAVTEFVRVSAEPLGARAFRREVPELAMGARTPSGLPVQVQILGGDPERMALSAHAAVEAGATAIDLNFGCPAPTVNRHDGGASLLRSPCRVRDVVRAVRDALPPEIPVSAKLRLGWDRTDAIDETAAMAAEGGAAWLTIHARTRVQGYAPPVFWPAIGRVRAALDLPVIANGDLWTLDDLRRCQDETGCAHFMLGRGAMADPTLPGRAARALGLGEPPPPGDWPALMRRLVVLSGESGRTLARMKGWLNLAHRFGAFRASTPSSGPSRWPISWSAWTRRGRRGAARHIALPWARTRFPSEKGRSHLRRA